MAGQTVPVKWLLLLSILKWGVSWANHHHDHEAPNFEAAFQGKCGPKSPCVQLCVELHDGTFECQCRAGYRLLQDGYSCVEASNTSYSDDDSEEEWIRTNSIQNRLIHEHHDQQRDLQLNNYRRSQAASRLGYHPFSGKSWDDDGGSPNSVTTSSASSPSSTPATAAAAARPEENSINDSRDNYVHNSVNEERVRDSKLISLSSPPLSLSSTGEMSHRRAKPTPFSFASKFSFDSHELPTLYGRPNNDEKLREALLLTSAERSSAPHGSDEDEDEDEEDDDDDDSSSEEDSEDDEDDEDEEDEEEDEDDDEVEMDAIFQADLKFLREKIENEQKRSRSDAPTIGLEHGEDPQGGHRPHDQSGGAAALDGDGTAGVGMSSSFDLDQSDSALTRPKPSSPSTAGEVGQLGHDLERDLYPWVGTTPVFSTFTTTTTTDSAAAPPRQLSSTSQPPPPPPSPPTSSSSTPAPSSEEEDSEETAGSGPGSSGSGGGGGGGVVVVLTSADSPTNQKCSLECKNGGWCAREGGFGGSSDDSKSQISTSSAIPFEPSVEESLAGYRCLCPMGYHGSFCEIEDGTEGDGYDSGLFRGQSWVAFPVLHDAYMSDQISLEFRPEARNGILLLTGERDDLSGDFLALYVRDGFLEFRFDCGSGSGMVRSSQPVNLQQWNRASIVRRRWEGWMQLNDGPFTQGRSKGLFSRITFRQPVFIGGAGNITFGSFAPSILEGDAAEGGGGSDALESRGKIEESELETEGPGIVTDSGSSNSNMSGGEASYLKANESKINGSVDDAMEDLTTTLPILRKIGGFRGCIRNLIINERTYRFGLEPAGDALQGFDIENCSDQGVCDLLNCQHGGQCIVQKDENPTCLCPLGYAGHFCETPLDLQIPSFNGSSYLKYGGLGLSRVLSWLELEIIVKPDAMDGLILYNGYKTDGMGDFISLVIDQGYVEFAVDLGTGTAIIRSDYPVALSEWHRILISRTSRLVSMRIDNQSPLMALTPGAFTQLSLPHNLFLGGIPDPQWLSPKVKVHGGFSGCIQKLVINGKPLRIMGSAMSGVNLENCAHPCLRNPCDHGGECVPQMDSFKCHCPLGYRDLYCQTRMDRQDVVTAPKLIGDSYLKFTQPRIIKRISGSRLNLSFRIRTSLSRGLILWAGRKLMTSASDFISVGLRNGFIHASFSLGSGQTTIAYNYTAVHDGQWHLVRLVRNEQEASLYVDDGPPVIGVAPGKLRQLNINDGLYIGGLDDPRHQSLNKYTEGLVGCITDLILGNDYRVALLQDASEGRNVDYCD